MACLRYSTVFDRFSFVASSFALPGDDAFEVIHVEDGNDAFETTVGADLRHERLGRLRAAWETWLTPLWNRRTDMHTERDKIIAKVKKCLALAKSSNEHEAATALRQAQKLMQETSRRGCQKCCLFLHFKGPRLKVGGFGLAGSIWRVSSTRIGGGRRAALRAFNFYRQRYVRAERSS